MLGADPRRTLAKLERVAAATAGSIVDATLLGRAATLEHVGNAAAFAAPDLARAVTAASLNISWGTFMDERTFGEDKRPMPD